MLYDDSKVFFAQHINKRGTYVVLGECIFKYAGLDAECYIYKPVGMTSAMFAPRRSSTRSLWY